MNGDIARNAEAGCINLSAARIGDCITTPKKGIRSS